VDTLEEGTRVYSGAWKESRPDDPRHFVIVQPAEARLGILGNPTGRGRLGGARVATGVPRAQRDSGHSFKGMIDHGGLDINYGRKTIIVPTGIISASKSNSNSLWRRPKAGG